MHPLLPFRFHAEARTNLIENSLIKANYEFTKIAKSGSFGKTTQLFLMIIRFCGLMQKIVLNFVVSQLLNKGSSREFLFSHVCSSLKIQWKTVLLLVNIFNINIIEGLLTAFTHPAMEQPILTALYPAHAADLKSLIERFYQVRFFNFFIYSHYWFRIADEKPWI